MALAPGEHTLEIADLPDSLEADSVRASGKGAGLKILGVEVATHHVTAPPEEAVAELELRLEGLRNDDKALADAVEAADVRQQFLTGLSAKSGDTLARGIAQGRVSVDAAEGVVGYVGRELDAVQARRRDLAQRRSHLAREIEALQYRLQQLRRVSTRLRKAIHVAVEAAVQTELRLEVTYAVSGASWTPVYDVRLQEKTVTVTYFASVVQQTSEAWQDVQLSLSTARPAVTSTIPELLPWYIDQYRPPVYHAPIAAPAPMMAARASAGTAATMVSVAREEAMPPPPAAVEEAAIETSGAAVTYRVPRPVSIPPDGTARKTVVTTLMLDCALDYITVPKLAEEAYLRATVKNTSPYTLLPGQAAIFHDDDFVGTMRLKTVAQNQEFEVQLGVDDRVKVERKLIEFGTAKGLIVDKKRTEISYKMVATNLLPERTKLTIFDQFPVARNEEIKVKLNDATPKPIEQSGLNILKWELQLEPQEKREITLSFTVEHPRGMTVVGLGN